MPARDRIHAVMVVPIFAPMMTLMAWERFINPELTKPTTMTVVAEEDWMTAVTPIPVISPINLPVVSLPSRACRLLPARRSSASPITFMPNRNRHRPPINVSASKMSICKPP